MANITKIFYKPLCPNWMESSESRTKRERVPSISVTEMNVVAMVPDENTTLTRAQRLKVNFKMENVVERLYIWIFFFSVFSNGFRPT